MARKKVINRKQHRFWLDNRIESEAKLNKDITTLKRRRMFISTIRQGIELILDLRAGRLEVLLFLFPWVKDALTPPAPPPPDTNALIAEFRKLLQEQGSRAIPMFDNDGKLLLAGEKPTVTTGRPIAGGLKPLSKPMVDDDDDVEIVVKKNTSTDAGLNFLAAMASLNAQ